MFLDKNNTEDLLKEIEINQPPYSIDHSKKISENYLVELEKFNTPEHQEFYNKEKKLIEEELKYYNLKQEIDFNPIIQFIAKKCGYHKFLNEDIEKFFNNLKLNCKFQEDLNKEFDSYPTYPTIKNRDNINLFLNY